MMNEQKTLQLLVKIGNALTSDEDRAAATTELESMIRTERDRLLTETDWWAVQDRTMSSEETQYRQALRDITEQDGFPTNITWPTKPEGA